MRPSSATPVRSIAAPPAVIGELIAGKYRIESLLGEGGMGAVFAAHHELLDVRVAVKLLSPAHLRQRSLVDRFLREARAAARLKSEHVARVMDLGTLEGGEPYIVMDLLEGEDLEERLHRVGRIATVDAVDGLLQALEAMANAHAAGIVHRDLKPANLFVTLMPDGREVIKVLDFGIAKLTDAEPGDKQAGTRSETVTDEDALGSPSYMAPEQVRGSADIDPRTDIWALGAILHELVTGEAAFGGQSMSEIFGAVLRERPKPVRALCPEAPVEIEAAVARCLERDKTSRFADVAQLARALAPFGSGAWGGHVTRIEQILARAGLAGGPDARPWRHHDSVGRIANVGAGAYVGIVRGSQQPADPARRAAAGAETLDPAKYAPEGEAPHRRRAATRVLASLVTLAAAEALFLGVGPRSAPHIEGPAGNALPPNIETVGAAPTPQPTMLANPSTQPWALPTAEPSPALPNLRRHRAGKPAPPASIAPPSKSEPSLGRQWPDGLDSPE